MTVLNRASDGLLSVLVALRNALLAFGPQTESKLLALAAPATVVPDGKPDMARRTLTRWVQLGFFMKEGQDVFLSSDLQSIGRDDINGFRAVVLRLLLRPDNNPAFASDAPDDEKSLASDWTRAAAWILAQDPYELPTGFGAKTNRGIEHLQNRQQVAPKPISNDTRWSGFVEWARFAGIGHATHGNSFVANPAFAACSALGTIFQGTRELPQAEFLRRLQMSVPVFDGGTYRVTVESQILRDWEPVLPNQVSPSLSIALLTLEAMRELRLEQRSDASQCTLIGRQRRPIRQVSHFVSVQTS
jgi:hypothetical protein